MLSGRVKYDRYNNYNKKVKIGPWVEETQQYEKKCIKHISSYSVDYTPKRYCRDTTEIWNNKFYGEGVHPRIIRDHDGQKYLENYSTSYDLSYNHLPRCYEGPIDRLHKISTRTVIPNVDLTENFGNITNYGILENKKLKWAYDKSKCLPTTTHNDTYVPFNQEALRFKRYATPIQNSTKAQKQTVELRNMNLRGKDLIVLPEQSNMVTVPQEPRCNPINWECPESLKNIPQRCVEKISVLQRPPHLYAHPPTLPYKCIMSGYRK